MAAGCASIGTGGANQEFDSHRVKGVQSKVIQLLTGATSAEEADRRADVAVLPIGSFEQHGEYLPLATDTRVACAIVQEIAHNYSVRSLPPITISCSHEHAAWAGTVSISARTLYSVILDIADSIRRSGVKRLVLVNGHGGNYVLSNVVQEYTAIHGPTMSLFPHSKDWTLARHEAGLTTDSHTDMHAGELETSILMHVAPDVIRLGNENADWQADDRPDLLTLGMRAYTTSGVIGFPSRGSAEKGAACLRSLAESFKTHVQAFEVQR
jgi:creatinine amidohydrolase